MTFDDDFCQVYFDTGMIRIRCTALNLDWPPPEKMSIEGIEYNRERFSQITDEQRSQMDHICRGAEYRPSVSE